MAIANITQGVVQLTLRFQNSERRITVKALQEGSSGNGDSRRIRKASRDSARVIKKNVDGSESELSELDPAVLLLLFDVDGTLIDSERAQEATQVQAAYAILNRSGYSIALNSELYDDARAHIKTCFEMGLFSSLMGGLIDVAELHAATILDRAGAPIHDPKTLDYEMTLLRLPCLLEACNRGEISFLPGADRLLETIGAIRLAARKLSAMGKRVRGNRVPFEVGLYTNSPQLISEGLLERLFISKSRFNKFLPVDMRLFGDQVPERKPNPIGWEIAVRNAAQRLARVRGIRNLISVEEIMRDPLRHALIIDDHPLVLQQAILAGCRSVIGICHNRNRRDNFWRLLSEGPIPKAVLDNTNIILVDYLSQVEIRVVN